MSFWMKMGLTISDLTCFKQSCKKNGIDYVLNEDENLYMQGMKVHAILNDTVPGGPSYSRSGFLVRDGGGYKVIIDNDPNYSSITNRLGKNGGLLTRNYAEAVVKKNVAMSGGFVQSTQEQPDGSVLLRVGVT